MPIHPPDAPPPPSRSASAPVAGERPSLDPDAWYHSREADAHTEGAALDRTLRTLATWRFLAFVAAVAPFLALETSPRSWWPVLLGAGIAAGALFAYLVARFRRVRRARERAKVRETVAQEGPARRGRRWEALPLPDLAPDPPADHPSATDLDLLGRASLAHLLGTPRTLPGRAALRSAILDPGGTTTPALRAERRHAAATLAAHPELLESVQVAARTVERKGDPEALSAFRIWARGPAWESPPVRRRLRLAALVLTAVNLVLLVGWFTGWPPAWILTVGATALLWFRVRGEAHPRFDAVEGAEDSLGRWVGLLEVAARLPQGSPLLDRIREGSASPVAGAEALAHLRRLSDWAQIRRSSLVYFPVALLTAWDVHPLVPMERWRETHGDAVERWLEAVGELELLVALGTLAFDHPDWVFPEELGAEAPGPEQAPGREQAPGVEVEPKASETPFPPRGTLTASDLRHPLLPPEVAVGNDVALPSPGNLLLVTGSNMSGKSTLLRAIGVNQVLLLAGGPVAASSYAAPPLVPWSSMRIRDSLESGVSLFMAELQRLRRVVDAARADRVLVLLDEILQGTNTAERRTAARTILGHLLTARAVGAVSTHDLTLADAPELAAALTQVHLRETVSGEGGEKRLSFDHRLRPGPATSRNALVLLELVGLAPDAPEGHDGGMPGGPSEARLDAGPGENPRRATPAEDPPSGT